MPKPRGRKKIKGPSTPNSGGGTSAASEELRVQATDKAKQTAELGKDLFAKQRYADAINTFEKAIKVCQTFAGQSNLELESIMVRAMANITQCHLLDADQPRGAEMAIDIGEKTLDRVERGMFPELHPKCFFRLIKAALMLGRFDAASTYLESARQKCPQQKEEWDDWEAEIDAAEESGQLPLRSKVAYERPKNQADLQTRFTAEACNQTLKGTTGTFQWAYSKQLCPVPRMEKGSEPFFTMSNVPWHDIDGSNSGRGVSNCSEFWHHWMNRFRESQTTCGDGAPDVRTMDALSFVITPARLICCLGLQYARSWKNGELHLVICGATKWAEERFARHPNLKTTKECDCYWAEFAIILAAAAAPSESPPKVHLHLVGPEVSCNTHWKDPDSALASVTCCKMEPPTMCNYLYENRGELSPENTCVTIMNPGFGNWNDPASSRWDLVWSYIADLTYLADNNYIVLSTSCHHLDMQGEICVWEGALNAKVIKAPLDNVTGACTMIGGHAPSSRLQGKTSNQQANHVNSDKKTSKRCKSKSKSSSPKHGGMESYSSNEDPHFNSDESTAAPFEKGGRSLGENLACFLTCFFKFCSQ